MASDCARAGGNSWPQLPLHELCVFNPRDRTPVAEEDELVPFVSVAALDAETGTVTGMEFKPKGSIQRAHVAMANGDILFTKISPGMENGKCAVVRNFPAGAWGSTEFYVLRSKGRVIPEWVHLFLRRRRLREEATQELWGTDGRKRVSSRWLQEVLIPTPPITVQRQVVARAVAMMAELRECRRVMNETATTAGTLLRAVIDDMFPHNVSDNPRLPKGGGVLPLTAAVSLGRSLMKPAEYPDEEFWLYSPAAYDRGMRPERVLGQSARGSNMPVAEGDLLLTVRNGDSCAWLVEPNGTDTRRIASAQFVRLTFVRDHEFDPRFVRYQLMSRGVLSQLRLDAEHTTTDRISLRQVEQVMLLCPVSLQTQQRVADHIEAIERECATILSHLAHDATRLEQVEQAILDRVFEGEL